MKKFLKWGLIAFFGLAFVSGVMKAIYPPRPAPEKETKAPADPEKDAALQRAGVAVLAIRGAMKDPQAFAIESVVVKPSGIGCLEYRGVNSFGAKLPGAAAVDKAGKILVQERDGNKFVKLWNTECTKGGGDDITQFVVRALQ